MGAWNSCATWRKHWPVLSLLQISMIFTLAVGGNPIPAYTVESVVVILLDDSGSMNELMRDGGRRAPRMEVAKNALRKVIQQLPTDTRLGVLLLNGARESEGWLIPLGPLDRNEAVSQIERLTARGGTPLGRSMKTAMEELIEHRRRQPYGDYRLLVVTDGEATDRSILQRHLPNILARGIAVDVIGVDMKSDHTLAQSAHSYRRANDAASFEQALSEIFAESMDRGQDQAGESDFDLLASLPDGFAHEVLPALAEMRAQPIDSKSTSVVSPEPSVAPVEQQTGSPRSQPGSWLNARFLLFFFALFVIIQWIIAWQNKRGKR
jgi:hypothetical protein